MAKIGRNDPCPCGSGKKYKRCCLISGGDSGPGSFTAEDRLCALDQFERFAKTKLGQEQSHAWKEFQGEWQDRQEEIGKLEKSWIEEGESVYDMWFCLDYELPHAECVADLFLRRNWHLSAGARGYIEELRKSVMRLYEVDDVFPGVSLTLRDVLSDSRVTVKERLGSRQLHKYALLAARVIARGPSGEPEIESGMLLFADMVKQRVISEFRDWYQAYMHEHPDSTGDEFFRQMPPYFYDVWLGFILDPPIPHLTNSDGDEVSVTRIQFDVINPAGLEAALDGNPELERTGESGEAEWLWLGPSGKGDLKSVYGRVILTGERLELECLSRQSGERGRALLEQEVPGMLRHCSTEHEDVATILRDARRARPEGQLNFGGAKREEIPTEDQERLVLDHMAHYYRQWLDEAVPALDDHTPREAARDGALRPKLIGLIQDLEGRYHQDLKEGKPAYDPSWMWTELNLNDGSRPMYAPPLAHERIALFIPGIHELCHSLAEQVRQRPGFKDASTVLSANEIRNSPNVRRFLGHEGWPAGPGPERVAMAGLAAQSMPVLVNFEIHRRKIFWVDEPLAYMLGKTNLDVTGAEVHMPFASFALAFTDRYTLSLAERMLSRGKLSRVAGDLLRVATVYVTEEQRDRRVISMTFAFDTLGADPPHLDVHEIPLADEQVISRTLDQLVPRAQPGSLGSLSQELPPLWALLHIAINAILYATSAGVAPEFRRGSKQTDSKRELTPPAAPAFSSEDVYFLPGKIEISHVRKLQALERVRSGRQLLHRFMVRGHWRRAAAGWADQGVRWINPYWKGPDMAAVVERAYRLKP